MRDCTPGKCAAARWRRCWTQPRRAAGWRCRSAPACTSAVRRAPTFPHGSRRRAANSPAPARSRRSRPGSRTSSSRSRRPPMARPADARRAPRFGLSFARIGAVLLKELVQLRRDRLTFAMLIGVPIMQLVLFGYAINSDPKHLPTAVVALDQSPLVRSIVRAAENTAYFHVVDVVSEQDAERLIARGEVQFALVFPSDFTAKVIRGERPAMAVYADATDPAATGAAVSA